MLPQLPLHKQQGFTLIEVLVALSIFAIIGIGCWQLMSQVLTTQQRLATRDAALADLQRGMWIMARDMRNLAARPIRNEYHAVEPAVSTLESGYQLTFTRNGWENPLNQPRGKLQRVAYQVDHAGADSKNTHLLRHYWPVLDRTGSTQPKTQVLVPRISYFQVSFIDRQGIPRSHWPPSGDDKPVQQLPLAVTIRFTTEDFGELTRTFALGELEPKL